MMGSSSIIPLDGALPESHNDASKPLYGGEVLAEFDRLVDIGVVKYDYSYVTEYHKINGLDASSYTQIFSAPLQC